MFGHIYFFFCMARQPLITLLRSALEADIRLTLVFCGALHQINSGLLPTEWVKTGGFCELMPILKGFSLTWRSLANGMLGDAKINQDKTPAG
jgi:hypothetical protein